jgi:HK97 gp10 family phage protein
MEVKLKSDQLKVLEDFFQDLSVIDQKKVFMASFRKAAKPMIIAAKKNAPMGQNHMIRKIPHIAGQLKRSIGTVEIPKNTSILVGAKLAGQPHNKGWYAHFLENGTKERVWRKQSFRKQKNIKERGSRSGKSTGRTPATHFFENAWNSTKDEVFGTIENEWYNEIDKLILRTNRKMKQ